MSREVLCLVRCREVTWKRGAADNVLSPGKESYPRHGGRRCLVRASCEDHDKRVTLDRGTGGVTLDGRAAGARGELPYLFRGQG